MPRNTSVKTLYTHALSDAKISRIFWQARSGTRKTCDRCSARRLYALGDGRLQCRRCRHKFGLYSGTYLSGCRLTPRQVLELLHYFALEYTANKAAGESGLPPQTVWRLFARIREALLLESVPMSVGAGEAGEIDESFFGPRFKNRRKHIRQALREAGLVKRGRGANQLLQLVFGIYKRNGHIYLEPISDSQAESLVPVIEERVVKGAIVYSDELPGYDGLVYKGYTHKRIEHGSGEYARYEKLNNENININGMEGFWGWAKERMLKYHGIGRGNWLLYLKELEWRYNHRRLSTEEKVDAILDILMRKKG